LEYTHTPMREILLRGPRASQHEPTSRYRHLNTEMGIQAPIMVANLAIVHSGYSPKVR
jgi:hypothetical protein